MTLLTRSCKNDYRYESLGHEIPSVSEFRLIETSWPPQMFISRIFCLGSGREIFMGNYAEMSSACIIDAPDPFSSLNHRYLPSVCESVIRDIIGLKVSALSQLYVSLISIMSKWLPHR